MTDAKKAAPQETGRMGEQPVAAHTAPPAAAADGYAVVTAEGAFGEVKSTEGTVKWVIDEDMATKLRGTAALLAEFADKAKEEPGAGYTEPRTIEIAVWDHCEAGDESVDSFSLEEGEAEVIATMIRQALEGGPSMMYRCMKCGEPLNSAGLCPRGCDQVAWSGWTRVSEERFIAEKGQIGVVQSRVFKTKADAEAYYGPLERWGTIVEIQVLRPSSTPAK